MGSAGNHHSRRFASALPSAAPDPEPAAPGDLRVVNSGTIDRYVNLWGNKPMRYLGNSYLHPVVPQDAAGRLPAVRQRQARTPKIIVAGMTRVLECIADLSGLLLPAKSTKPTSAYVFGKKLPGGR